MAKGLFFVLDPGPFGITGSYFYRVTWSLSGGKGEALTTEEIPTNMTSEDAFRISRIKGNASDNVKRALANPAVYLHAYQPSFGAAITDRLICTEISLDKKLEEPAKLEAKVVVELEVKEGKWSLHVVHCWSIRFRCTWDMLNGAAIVHGGCSAFLIDMYVNFACRLGVL